MSRNYSPEFKKDAIKYVRTHTELTYKEASANLGIPQETLYGWIKAERKREDPESYTEDGKQSEMEKENIRLRRELKDAKDAIEILKKAIGILGE